MSTRKPQRKPAKAKLTSLPCEKRVGDKARKLADSQGLQLIRFVGALVDGWQQLNAAQQMKALRA